MKLVVAIIPSNQDRNPVLGGRNEMQQVAPFCDHLYEAFQQYPNITAKVFTPEPESGDTYEYEALYTIQKEVAAYLKTFPLTEYIRLATNWHTDSGSYSHVGGYYETNTTESKQLAERVKLVLNRWFNGSLTGGNYSGYIFARLLKGVAPAVLYEVGSHQVKADVEVLDNYGKIIANAVVADIAAYYGHVPEGILSHLDMLWGYSNELTKASQQLKSSAQAGLALADSIASAADIVRERVVAIKQELGL